MVTFLAIPSLVAARITVFPSTILTLWSMVGIPKVQLFALFHRLSVSVSTNSLSPSINHRTNPVVELPSSSS